MKIPGLYSYINQILGNSLDSYELNNTKLIIDGSSISHHLLSQSQKDSSLFSDGLYQAYFKCVKNFFNKLIEHKVDFIVILDGTWKPQQQNYILQKLNDNIENAEKEKNFKDDLYHSSFLLNIFLEVIKKLKITYQVSTFKLTNPIISISKLLNHPILTANSELCLYGIDCIFLHSLNIYKNNDQASDKITCKIIRPNKFVQRFPGLKVSCLPILSVLFNTEYIDNSTLFRLSVNSSKLISKGNYKPHILIDRALWWLTKHTLKSAAQEIIPLIMSTGKSLILSKKIIEDIINSFIKTPTCMLKYFANLPSFKIDEAQIFEIENKFVEFKFDDENETASNFESAENDLQKIKKKVTNFFINDLLTGKLSSIVINLIEHETYIPWYQVEHLEFPSVYEMSVPLISFIYGLLLSCTEEEKVNPLKLYIRENLKIQCREINVDKYPLRLRDIRKSDLNNKLEIINEVLLGVKKSDSLEGLPKEWRLFTATLVFWMKQKSNPEKGEIYLYTLLLAMFFTITEKKLNSSDDENSSDKLLEKGMEAWTVGEQFESKNDKSVQLIKAIENINSEDTEVQIHQIFSVNSSSEKLSKHTIHIFLQFQCVLEHSRTINALLDFPYHQPDISKVFNSKRIKNLFLYLSYQSQSIEKKIHDQMQPSILEAFKLLEESVIPLLH